MNALGLNELIWAAIGALLWPACKLLAILAHCAHVAWVDATNFYKYRQLKDGVSRLHWAWIIPNEFRRSFFNTFVCHINGLERVI